MRDAQLRERIKSYVLAILVVASLVQVGIHWDRQGQGGPLRFLSSALSPNNILNVVDDRLLEARKREYIQPNRIVVSDEESMRWILQSFDDTWTESWKDLRDQYLPQLVTAKPDRRQARSTWDQLLLSRRAMLFEFETAIPTPLLAWLAGTEFSRSSGQAADGFPDVEKIAVVPSENVNVNVNTLYVLASDGVYRFLLDVPETARPKAWYLMSQDYLAREGSQPVTLLGEAYFGLNHIRRDLLIWNDNHDRIMLPLYEMAIPSFIPEEFTVDNLDPLQEKILLGRKESLLIRLDEETGNVTFSDIENTFRMDANGYLSYRYLPGAQDTATDMGGAFRQALSFVEERRQMLGAVDLVLTDVAPGNIDGLRSDLEGAERNPAYVFSFSYRVDGNLMMQMDQRTGDPVAPITVAASADRIIRCDWSIRQFRPIEQARWSLFFFDLYNDMITSIPNLRPGVEVLSRTRYGYLFSSREQTAILKPSWILSSDRGIYLLPMRQEGE